MHAHVQRVPHTVIVKKNVLHSFGNQIGVGKEADVYVVGNEEQKQLCLKIHR